jgi:hypothetical protein
MRLARELYPLVRRGFNTGDGSSPADTHPVRIMALFSSFFLAALGVLPFTFGRTTLIRRDCSHFFIWRAFMLATVAPGGSTYTSETVCSSRELVKYNKYFSNRAVARKSSDT